MGLVTDSSVLVAAERQHLLVSTLLEELQQQHNVTEIFALGHQRSRTGARHLPRPSQCNRHPSGGAIWDTVFAAIPARPFTREIGRTVAEIDAKARMRGTVIPFADLLIGGTALHFGYGLVTSNVRHFQNIPELRIFSF